MNGAKKPRIADESTKTWKGEDDFVGCWRFKVRRHTYLTALLVAIMVVLNADQNLLAPVMTPIAREFGFIERYPNGSAVMIFDDRLEIVVEKVDAQMRDEKLGGDILLAFFVIGGAVSLIIGYLTDVVNRRNTLAAVVIFGETACLATYFTTTYWGLWITRALTGVSVGGAAPLVFSLFGDLFSAKYRGRAIAAAAMAIGAGTGIGQTLMGPIAGEDGKNWRMAFLVVSIPAYFLAALLLLTVEEPKRGTMEEAYHQYKNKLADEANQRGDEDLAEDVVYSERITWKKFIQLLKTPSVLLVFLQGIPGSLPWGIFGSLLSDFLAEEKNIDIRLTGLILMIFGLGSTVGSIVAGFMVDRLFENHKKIIPIILAALTIIGSIPMAVYIEVPTSSFAVTALFVIPAGFCLGFAGNTTKVILVNVTVPETRGAAFSILNLFDDLGKGFGVFFLSRFFALFSDSPGKTARAKGIQAGFLIGWMLCGLAIGAIYFFIEKDYAHAQHTVKSNLEKDDLALQEMNSSSSDADVENATTGTQQALLTRTEHAQN